MTERRGAAYGAVAGSLLWLLSRSRIVLQNSSIVISLAPPFSLYADLIAAGLATTAFLVWIGSMIRHKALLGTTRNGFIFGVASSFSILQVIFRYLLHTNIIS